MKKSKKEFKGSQLLSVPNTIEGHEFIEKFKMYYNPAYNYKLKGRVKGGKTIGVKNSDWIAIYAYNNGVRIAPHNIESLDKRIEKNVCLKNHVEDLKKANHTITFLKEKLKLSEKNVHDLNIINRDVMIKYSNSSEKKRLIFEQYKKTLRYKIRNLFKKEL